MAGQTYEWIRIDADFEWIAAIAFDQKDYMWVSQLQRDRDVVAQYEVRGVAYIASRREIDRAVVGYHGPVEDTKSDHLEYLDEDGTCHELLLPDTLRGGGGARYSEFTGDYVHSHASLINAHSARTSGWNGWGSSTSSSSFCVTAMSQRTRRQTCSVIRTCRGRTTSATSRSTLYGRYIH